MESIVDQEIMDEIAAEQAAAENADGQADTQSETQEEIERAEALTEPEPTNEQGENQSQDADQRELPELEPMEEAQITAETAVEDKPPNTALPESVLGLLGVSSQDEAIERLTTIAVNQLVEQGAPEVVARELVSLRMKAGGMPTATHKARDEPKTTEPAADAATNATQTAENKSAEVTPRIKQMAEQAQYVQERTGIDMMAEIRKDPELMKGISEYNSGKGGFDMIGAYNKLREKTMSARTPSKVPATTGMGGGQTSSPRMRVEDMTDEDIERIEERVRRGERVIL